MVIYEIPRALFSAPDRRFSFPFRRTRLVCRHNFRFLYYVLVDNYYYITIFITIRVFPRPRSIRYARALHIIHTIMKYFSGTSANSNDSS